MLSEMSPDIFGEAITSAPNDVNTMDPNLLDSTASDMIHHDTAKLLFLCKRTCVEIQPAVAFLCTRVKQPNRDDYKS